MGNTHPSMKSLKVFTLKTCSSFSALVMPEITWLRMVTSLSGPQEVFPANNLDPSTSRVCPGWSFIICQHCQGYISQQVKYPFCIIHILQYLKWPKDDEEWCITKSEEDNA